MSDDRRGRRDVTREVDPEARWPDPERELPSVPEAPAPPDTEPATVVAVAFWKSVLVVNYAIFAVSFGPMLAYFRGETLLGAAIFVSGVLAFVYAVLIYRQFRRREEDENDS